jgi:hydroxypyruvate isomerase
MPELLAIDEITILTSFAQAVAEAVACAPECVEDVLTDAPAGAPWRGELGIAEPSAQLDQAFAVIGRLTREVAAALGVPTLDALIAASDENADEERLDRLARRVFRSALEQRRYRTSETTR